MIFPDPVISTRLPVPLCVFNFGTCVTPYYYTHTFSGHLNGLIEGCNVTELLHHLVKQHVTQLDVCHFASAKDQYNFHFMAFLQKTTNLAAFYLKIVRTDPQAKIHLFYLDGLGVSAAALLLFH